MAVTISAGIGVSVVSTVVTTMTVSMAIVSMPSISSGISLRFSISRPLAEVTISISSIGISISTIVLAISGTVAKAVSTGIAMVSMPSISIGISRPLTEVTE